MKVVDALREYRWVKQYSPASLKLSRFRLGAWAEWLAERGVTEVEAMTAGHVREYQRHLTSKPGRNGVAPPASETLLGCAKMLHAFLV